MTKGKANYQTTSLPAPVGGLNARDSVALMPPTDAVIMENWFPETTGVSMRKGCVRVGTIGIFSAVPCPTETVLTYTSSTTDAVFIAGGDRLEKLLSGGGGSTELTGLVNGRFQYTNMGTAAGHYLVAVNGADSLKLYNGTSWQSVTGVSTPIAITGVDTSTLIDVTLHKQRLWFVKKDSMSAYYLDAGAVGGAAVEFPLDQLFALGGRLVTVMSWTVDNAIGMNDYIAFLTSEGEVAVYQGVDPSDATDFTQIAKFRIGRPIGQRCWTKYGGDCLVITSDGVFPMSKLLDGKRSQENAITDKIRTLVNSDIQMYGANFGWQVVYYPYGNKIILNVPYQENYRQYQYVMNTVTGSWTKFSGWDANCWGQQEDTLYFGRTYTSGSFIVGILFQADVGYQDEGVDGAGADTLDINAKCKPAFSYFGTPGLNKQWTMVRPNFTLAGGLNPVISLNVDFGNRLPSSTPSYTVSGSPWDTSPWDTSAWSSSVDTQGKWQTVGGIGKCATIYMQVAHQQDQVTWLSTDWVYQQGGIL